ncbi:SDR family NAD(P)-dependent oxidoreductase [Streptomyces sp. NBC_01381]|uniref:SDR family NAD(P)-dependent oxidoreductase n=1 Tax=Streptomyces sp. NBC_01381 TaxID=2903845 RepID=UPI00225BF09D|nr:SDR family NAD(P)-dependent oxidoreductase [Streptomyces sp. NBC_01381]MCX4673157.1 SDR family NAD(P)-dependent oxidoreductase [Streptomyces sp. NBC_01381]
MEAELKADMATLHGTTALITGGTGGIGKETARGLVRRGAHVILVGRDPGRAADAVRELQHEVGGGRVEAVTADLTLRAGLRRVADAVNAGHAGHAGLDVLVNNFGMNPAERRLTADGVETAFAANVLAPFALTRLLMPNLRKSPAARVINLTGGIPRGPVDPANLQAEKAFIGWTFGQYNHTKAQLMAVSYEYAQRIADDGVTVNVAYPGHAYTPGNQATPMRAFPRLYRPAAPLVRLLGPILLADLAKPARSSIHLATSPEVAGVTGAYFDSRCRRVPWPDFATDPRTRKAVWSLCERLYDQGAVGEFKS